MDPLQRAWLSHVFQNPVVGMPEADRAHLRGCAALLAMWAIVEDELRFKPFPWDRASPSAQLFWCMRNAIVHAGCDVEGLISRKTEAKELLSRFAGRCESERLFKVDGTQFRFIADGPLPMGFNWPHSALSEFLQQQRP